jgi:NADPH:quinone reductase
LFLSLSVAFYYVDCRERSVVYSNMEALMPRVVRFDEYGPPKVLRMVEEPEREPLPNEVRLRAEALGLMVADQLFRAGTYPEPAELPGAGLGYEVCGVVDAVGKDVRTVEPGDRVSSFTNFSLNDYSTHAESVVLPERSVTKTPPNLTPEQGASFWSAYLTAYCGVVELGHLEPGSVVLATAGTSSVGTAAVQVAKALGAVVITTTRSRDHRERLERVGADHVVVSTEENLGEVVAAVTSGRGVDIVFDSVGGAQFQNFGAMATVGGRLIAYGVLSGELPVVPVAEIMARNLSLDVYTLFTHTGNRHFHAAGQPEVVGRARRFVLDGIALGHLQPLVTKVFEGFDRYLEATEFVEEGRSVGKVAVRL